MPPEVTEEQLKEYNAFKEAKDKADKEAKDKADKEKNKKADPEEEEEEEEEEKGDDLREKVRKAKEGKEKSQSDLASIEKSLAFNMGVDRFVKDHADILPPEITAILAEAQKEKYDSAGEKASAIKASFILEFFAEESHVELLTASQKSALDGYLKLTKNGKQAKANDIYENLFEPALETLKKVKKAEELGKARSGFGNSSKVEDGYKERLIAGSRKLHLNEK